MKKKINGLLILIVLFLTGCSHNYNSIPHNKFLTVFNDKKDYQVINKTSIDKGIYEKSFEVGNGYITFYYLEFNSTKEAKDYMKLSYNNKKFKYKSNKNYSIAKRKLSKIYIKAVQIDKMIIIGMGNEFKDRFEINKIFREFKMW